MNKFFTLKNIFISLFGIGILASVVVIAQPSNNQVLQDVAGVYRNVQVSLLKDRIGSSLCRVDGLVRISTFFGGGTAEVENATCQLSGDTLTIQGRVKSLNLDLRNPTNEHNRNFINGQEGPSFSILGIQTVSGVGSILSYSGIAVGGLREGRETTFRFSKISDLPQLGSTDDNLPGLDDAQIRQSWLDNKTLFQVPPFNGPFITVTGYGNGFTISNNNENGITGSLPRGGYVATAHDISVDANGSLIVQGPLTSNEYVNIVPDSQYKVIIPGGLELGANCTVSNNPNIDYRQRVSCAQKLTDIRAKKIERTLKMSAEQVRATRTNGAITPTDIYQTVISETNIPKDVYKGARVSSVNDGGFLKAGHACRVIPANATQIPQGLKLAVLVSNTGNAFGLSGTGRNAGSSFDRIMECVVDLTDPNNVTVSLDGGTLSYGGGSYGTSFQMIAYDGSNRMAILNLTATSLKEFHRKHEGPGEWFNVGRYNRPNNPVAVPDHSPSMTYATPDGRSSVTINQPHDMNAAQDRSCTAENAKTRPECQYFTVGTYYTTNRIVLNGVNLLDQIRRVITPPGGGGDNSTTYNCGKINGQDVILGQSVQVNGQTNASVQTSVRGCRVDGNDLIIDIPQSVTALAADKKPFSLQNTDTTNTGVRLPSGVTWNTMTVNSGSSATGASHQIHLSGLNTPVVTIPCDKEDPNLPSVTVSMETIGHLTGGSGANNQIDGKVKDVFYCKVHRDGSFSFVGRSIENTGTTNTLTRFTTVDTTWAGRFTLMGVKRGDQLSPLSAKGIQKLSANGMRNVLRDNLKDQANDNLFAYTLKNVIWDSAFLCQVEKNSTGQSYRSFTGDYSIALDRQVEIRGFTGGETIRSISDVRECILKINGDIVLKSPTRSLENSRTGSAIQGWPAYTIGSGVTGANLDQLSWFDLLIEENQSITGMSEKGFAYNLKRIQTTVSDDCHTVEQQCRQAIRENESLYEQHGAVAIIHEPCLRLIGWSYNRETTEMAPDPSNHLNCRSDIFRLFIEEMGGNPPFCDKIRQTQQQLGRCEANHESGRRNLSDCPDNALWQIVSNGVVGKSAEDARRRLGIGLAVGGSALALTAPLWFLLPFTLPAIIATTVTAATGLGAGVTGFALALAAEPWAEWDQAANIIRAPQGTTLQQYKNMLEMYEDVACVCKDSWLERRQNNYPRNCINISDNVNDLNCANLNHANNQQVKAVGNVKTWYRIPDAVGSYAANSILELSAQNVQQCIFREGPKKVNVYGQTAHTMGVNTNDNSVLAYLANVHNTAWGNIKYTGRDNSKEVDFFSVPAESGDPFGRVSFYLKKLDERAATYFARINAERDDPLAAQMMSCDGLIASNTAMGLTGMRLRENVTSNPTIIDLSLIPYCQVDRRNNTITVIQLGSSLSGLNLPANRDGSSTQDDSKTMRHRLSIKGLKGPGFNQTLTVNRLTRRAPVPFFEANFTADDTVNRLVAGLDATKAQAVRAAVTSFKSATNNNDKFRAIGQFFAQFNNTRMSDATFAAEFLLPNKIITLNVAENLNNLPFATAPLTTQVRFIDGQGHRYFSNNNPRVENTITIKGVRGNGTTVQMSFSTSDNTLTLDANNNFIIRANGLMRGVDNPRDVPSIRQGEWIEGAFAVEGFETNGQPASVIWTRLKHLPASEVGGATQAYMLEFMEMTSRGIPGTDVVASKECALATAAASQIEFCTDAHMNSNYSDAEKERICGKELLTVQIEDQRDCKAIMHHTGVRFERRANCSWCKDLTNTFGPSCWIKNATPALRSEAYRVLVNNRMGICASLQSSTPAAASPSSGTTTIQSATTSSSSGNSPSGSTSTSPAPAPSAPSVPISPTATPSQPSSSSPTPTLIKGPAAPAPSPWSKLINV